MTTNDILVEGLAIINSSVSFNHIVFMQNVKNITIEDAYLDQIQRVSLQSKNKI